MLENIPVPLSLLLRAAPHARTERSLVINDLVRSTMRKLAGWLGAVRAWGARLRRARADARCLRSAIRELHELDDRTLADMGITRCGIETAVRDGVSTRVNHRLPHDPNWSSHRAAVISTGGMVAADQDRAARACP
jgi:uncharacterized protein YjiS (DUF1127 family)